VPHQLVSLLREVSTELETLGNHAADQAAEARATALSITLEAVKSGLPPGKLRDLAVRMREEATHAAERLSHDRARISLRIGQALARATTLAREADVLAPTRQRAAWLATALHQASRQIELGGQAAASSPLITSISRVDARPHRVHATDDGVVLHVPDGDQAWRAELDLGALEAAWLAGDPERVALVLAGQPDAVHAAPSGLQPRIWLVADDAVDVLASHREASPQVELPQDQTATVVELGRRRVAVARVPVTVPGLEGWRVLATAAPRLKTTRPRPRQAGEVILFPGVR